MVDESGDPAKRLGDDIPMSIASVLLKLAGDTSLKSVTAIHAGVLMGRHATPDGWVGSDESGRSLSDPRNVATVLGYAPSSIAKAFADLEKLGYIEYRRASGHERRHGIHGRVRFILPSAR